MWWSINTLSDGGQVYFYAYTGDTRVVLTQATDFSDISLGTLAFTDWTVGPVSPGAIVVFHNAVQDRYVALRLDAVYSTDPSAPGGAELCAGIDASWSFELKP
jgi:hypothetical protein